MSRKTKLRKAKTAATTESPAHFFDKVIELLFYSLFFFVPLILWPRTSEVFEFNKMLFVYVVTILIGTAWVGKWIVDKQIRIRRTPLDFFILLFLCSQTISTLFSIDLHTSIWGYYSRFHGGLASTISYLVLYYAFVSNIKPKAITFILFSILSSAALVALYGILEHLGIDKNVWIQDVQNRVFSTLGQPNWLSAYLVALIPLPAFLALKQKNKLLSAGLFSLSLLFIITTLFTKSQSGIGAMIVTLGLMFVYFVFEYILKKLPRPGKIAVAAFLLILLAAGSVYKWQSLLKLSPFGVPNLPVLIARDNQTRFGGSDSMLIRQVVWSGARQLANKYPFFGTGVETYGYTYYWVRPALHNQLSEWEFLYNKAHNEFLNFLANTGFVGLLSYLLLIASTIVLLIKVVGVKWRGATGDAAAASNRARTSSGGGNLTESTTAIAVAFLIGYISILITNYFGFSVVPIALFFFLFPAIVIVISNHHEEYLSIKFPINSTLGLFVICLGAFFLLTIPYKKWTADLAYTQGKALENTQYLKQSLDYLQTAVATDQSEPVYSAELGQIQAQAAVAVKQQMGGLSATDSASIKAGQKLLDEFVAAANDNVTRAISMNHYQTNYYKNAAKAYLYLGVVDPTYNQKALSILLELAKLAPTDAKVFYNIAILYDQLGQKDLAKKTMQHVIELKPDYFQAKDYLDNLSKKS